MRTHWYVAILAGLTAVPTALHAQGVKDQQAARQVCVDFNKAMKQGAQEWGWTTSSSECTATVGFATSGQVAAPELRLEEKKSDVPSSSADSAATTSSSTDSASHTGHVADSAAAKPAGAGKP